MDLRRGVTYEQLMQVVKRRQSVMSQAPQTDRPEDNAKDDVGDKTGTKCPYCDEAHRHSRWLCAVASGLTAELRGDPSADPATGCGMLIIAIVVIVVSLGTVYHFIA
jgi:hypothetical protein